MSNTSLDEELIDQYVQDGNTEAAVRLIYDLIVRYAKQKNFTKAELLRQKLFLVNPMALTEIIKSAEIIEEEKNVSIDVSHKGLWAKLYSLLTAEETNILYYALKEAVFEPDQPVFRQGQLNPKIYFINHGDLKLTCKDNEREVLLGTISTGDIVGDENFFLNTVCTTSLIPISAVRANYLDKDVLAKWEKEHPLLVSKLWDYCEKASKTQVFLEQYHVDRRTQKRVQLSGKCQIQIVNSAGEAVGRPFYGELSDISTGGMSFLVRITKKETSRMLLGRRVKLVFDLPVAGTEQAMEREGTIVAVRDRAFEDCSIHIKFKSQLSKELLDGIG